MAITRYYKVITPRSRDQSIPDGQDLVGSQGVYGNYTWYNRIVQGSAHRKTRYREYDVMDGDPDISLALDFIAEEMVGNNPKSKLPLEVKIHKSTTEEIPTNTVMTLNAALKTFVRMQELDTNRLYNICRSVIKYGDVVFLKSRDKNGKWANYINPKNVISAIVAKHELTDIKGVYIKTDFESTNSGFGTNLYANAAGDMGDHNVQPFKIDDVVWFSLRDEMSEESPFGLSVLRAIYKVFKQKELLEDSIVIYRIQRAPERRVFYIDVGRTPPNEVSAILEKVKNDFRQKRIPSQFGGKSQVDAIYNPQSMQEDFFMAVRPNSQGGRIETLPGGQNLGELEDLQYFFKRMWRGLKIPDSYINSMSEPADFNDVKVGIALMQEVKFTLYIQRLQTYIETVLDKEFKTFMFDNGINIDPALYSVVLPEPSNYHKSRQQAIDTELINTYANTTGMKELSPRFKLKKYLQLTDAEIAENERMRREELGLNVDGGREDYPKIYAPEEAEAGGFEGGLGGLSSPPGGGGPGEFGEEEGGEEGEGGPEEPTAPESPGGGEEPKQQPAEGGEEGGVTTEEPPK